MQVKVNTVHRLGIVCSTMGEESVVSDLIPYLKSRFIIRNGRPVRRRSVVRAGGGNEHSQEIRRTE